ncbi:MAG TPA: hypothetical protein G4O07_05755 [Dehalococcoidia bacterium]|nr:hypothetical protein [Dehalococcoidia bacterium]
MALSGTFSLQEFELPQGTEISHPSIYLVVFNHSDSPMDINMKVDAPYGVEVLIGETEFTLDPDGEQRLFVTIRVTKDTAPGEYELIITARSTPVGEVGSTGAALASASAQSASLIVTGTAAWVKARVITADGFPIEAQLRLFKVLDEKVNNISQTETGEMEVTVAPGTYRIVAYIAGRVLAQEEFEIRADETKEIELMVRTAYIEQFGIEENYPPDSNDLSFIRMVYSINNLSGPLDDVEVLLKVTLDGQPLEQVSLMSFGRLEAGRTGGSGSYIPAAGWKQGHYTFKLELHVEDEFYIESEKQELSLKPSVTAPIGISLYWWILIGAAIIALAAFLWFRKRGEEEEEEEKPEEEIPPAAEEEAELPEAEAEAGEEVEPTLPEEATTTEEEVSPTAEVEEEAETAEEVPPPTEEAATTGEEVSPTDEVEEEAEEVPEGEIEEPPEAVVEAEVIEEVPEGEIEEPPEEGDKPAV